jgi:hypothetical protein
MVHVPVVTIVIFNPEVVHTLLVEEVSKTVWSELAVAPDANGVVERCLRPGFVNVMVWLALLNVTVVAEDDAEL